MKKLYDIVKSPVGRGICYLTLLATVAGIAGCKSQIQKQIEETKQRTELEMALTEYDRVLAKRLKGQIENVAEIKDELSELEDNFYKLNFERVKKGMIPMLTYVPWTTFPWGPYTPYNPNPPRQPGFYPQERSRTEQPTEQPKDSVTTKNSTKGAWPNDSI